jgi:hypothetical protein
MVLVIALQQIKSMQIYVMHLISINMGIMFLT